MLSILQLMQRARVRWRWMALGVAVGVAVVFANTLLMALSGWFITSMALAGISGVAFNYFAPSAGIRLLAITRTAGRYGERLITHEAAFRSIRDLRQWLFDGIAPLAPAGLEKYADGEVASRLRADVDAMEASWLKILTPLFTGVISAIGAVLFLWLFDAMAALFLLISFVFAGAVLPALIHRLSKNPGRRVPEQSSRLRVQVTRGIEGMEELILLGAAAAEADQIDAMSTQLISDQQRLAEINGIGLGGTTALTGIGTALVLIAAAAALQNGTITGPILVMIVLFTPAAFESVIHLTGALHSLPSAAESSRRLLELMDTPPPVSAPPADARNMDGADISICGLFAGYVPGVPVLSDIHLEIPAGSTVAITGDSGSGKSLLFEILLRLRDYTGSIRVGGVELRELSDSSRHANLCGLAQKPHLFNDTIEANIRIGNPDASALQVEHSLKIAGISEWISRLDQKIHTPVGRGGAEVSGGEAKRIALARTLLKDTPILILDEPTEGLDPETEREVLHYLKRETVHKTLLIFTHRPACLALCKYRIHLDNSGHIKLV